MLTSPAIDISYVQKFANIIESVALSSFLWQPHRRLDSPRITVASTISPKYDIIIVGSGAAGLTLALRSADSARVAVLSKGDLNQGATFYAQGGIAAVLDNEDSIKSHVDDTLIAGVGLCHKEMVEYVVSSSGRVVSWLVEQGVPFTTLNDAGEAPTGEQQPRTEMELASLHLTKEAGHSHRRIIHATDATGKAVFKALHAKAVEHPNIELLEGRTAIDLVMSSDSEGNKRCTGLYVLNQFDDTVELLQASCTVLATGGASKAYLYTSNPDGASGDGIAMAWRAGCRIANMEFNQFHPTCLYHPQAKSFLITEALRGEGALLELPDGTRFMPKHDERAELAPRDVVARAIDYEMKRLGCDCVYLNISHKPAAFIESHFPTIHARCLDFGIDISKDRIPVVPAAHYTCGGVMVDQNSATDIANLYAVGETSFTGLHGANRMASNSLLECFVLAFAAAKHIREQLTADVDSAGDQRLPWDDSRVSLSENQVLISHNWDELRRCMWDFVGIVRNNRRLERADRRLELIEQEVNEYYRSHRITSDLLELRNLVLVSRLIVSSARSRKESRGLHYNLDFPQLLDEAKDTVLQP